MITYTAATVNNNLARHSVKDIINKIVRLRLDFSTTRLRRFGRSDILYYPEQTSTIKLPLNTASYKSRILST